MEQAQKSTGNEITSSPTRGSRTGGLLVWSLVIAATAFAVFRFGEQWLRTLLLYLSRARWARVLVTNFGRAWRVASRFVAGESVDEAIVAAQQLNAKGMSVTLDFLGESVSDAAEANAARDQILWLLDRIRSSGVNSTVSVKLSQLGLKVDENLAFGNLQALLERARGYSLRVRIDMEESALVDTTLDFYHRLRAAGYDNVGVVIQSYLYRSEKDVNRLIEDRARVRLVKGAYKESPDIAYPHKADVDKAFVRLAERMLGEQARANGVFLAVASHDDAMIEATQRYALQHNIPSSAYEFQLLYGIRRDLQEELIRQGYQVRIYVPYGTAWYPYFMRRLAERPANLWFFVANFFRA